MFLYGKSIAQLIKATLGITAWSGLRVPIDGLVRDLDVGSSSPPGAAARKGAVVRRIKWHVAGLRAT